MHNNGSIHNQWQRVFFTSTAVINSLIFFLETCVYNSLAYLCNYVDFFLFLTMYHVYEINIYYYNIIASCHTIQVQLPCLYNVIDIWVMFFRNQIQKR